MTVTPSSLVRDLVPDQAALPLGLMAAVSKASRALFIGASRPASARSTPRPAVAPATTLEYWASAGSSGSSRAWISSEVSWIRNMLPAVLRSRSEPPATSSWASPRTVMRSNRPPHVPAEKLMSLNAGMCGAGPLSWGVQPRASSARVSVMGTSIQARPVSRPD